MRRCSVSASRQSTLHLYSTPELILTFISSKETMLSSPSKAIVGWSSGGNSSSFKATYIKCLSFESVHLGIKIKVPFLVTNCSKHLKNLIHFSIVISLTFYLYAGLNISASFFGILLLWLGMG